MSPGFNETDNEEINNARREFSRLLGKFKAQNQAEREKVEAAGAST